MPTLRPSHFPSHNSIKHTTLLSHFAPAPHSLCLSIPAEPPTASRILTRHRKFAPHLRIPPPRHSIQHIMDSTTSRTSYARPSPPCAQTQAIQAYLIAHEPAFRRLHTL